MKARCLKHPDAEVEFLNGIEDIANTYCHGGDGEHEIVIDTELLAYHDVHHNDIRTAAVLCGVFVVREESASKIVRQMEYDGVADKYRWYKLTEIVRP